MTTLDLIMAAPLLGLAFICTACAYRLFLKDKNAFLGVLGMVLLTVWSLMSVVYFAS